MLGSLHSVGLEHRANGGGLLGRLEFADILKVMQQLFIMSTRVPRVDRTGSEDVGDVGSAGRG